MFELIILPSLDSFMASTTPWSQRIFTELIPIALAIAGLIIGAIFVRAFFKGVLNAVKTLTGGRRGKRR